MCVNCTEFYCAHTHKPTEIKSAKFDVLNFDAKNHHALRIGATSYDDQHIMAEINANTQMPFAQTNKQMESVFFFFVDKRFNHLASSLPDFRAFHRINSIDTGRVIRNCRRKKRSSIYIKFMSPSANDGANHQKYASLLREPIAEFKIVGGPSFDTSTTSITPNH